MDTVLETLAAARGCHDSLQAWVARELRTLAIPGTALTPAAPTPGRATAFAATGGTIEAIARLAQSCLDPLELALLPMGRLDAVIHLLQGMSVRERMDELGLRADRADVILPAALVHRHIAQMAPSETYSGTTCWRQGRRAAGLGRVAIPDAGAHAVGSPKCARHGPTANGGDSEMTEPTISREPESRGEPDKIAGEWLVECWEIMMAVAWRFFGDEEMATEVVQQACLVVLRRVRDGPHIVDEVRKPCRWLAGITANVARGWIRDRARHARILEENALEISETLYPSDEREWRVERMTEEVLAGAPSTLTPKQLDVVRAVLAGKTDEAIAAELDVSSATVRSHRSTAARRLRDKFDGVGE